MGALSFLRGIFERRSSVNLGHPRDPALAEMFAGWYSTGSGVNVTPERALEDSAVYACDKVISEDIAKLPMGVYRRLDGGGREHATDHPLDRVLSIRPCRRMSSVLWRKQGQHHVNIRGNAYFFKLMDGAGRIVQLLPLHPDRVRPFEAPNGDRAYVYTPPKGGQVIYLQDEVLHLMSLSVDGGLTGCSVIKWHKETIGGSIAAKEYGGKFFGNSARPAGLLILPGNVTPEQRKDLKKEWARLNGGGAEQGVAVMPKDVTFTPLSLTSEEAQFLETRKFSRSEIAGLFRVPPHKIGDLERSTNNNIEHQGIEYVTDCLMPVVAMWEQELTHSLLSQADQRAGYFVRINVNGLLRGDMQARAEFYRALFNVGALSQDDIRELEDENPIPGGGGKKYYVPLNMRPHDQPMPIPEPKASREQRSGQEEDQ